MPSNNKNIIGNLRQRYEPHMKLSANVDLNHKIIHQLENKTRVLDEKLTDLPKIHATLSKSFGLQRKTLKRLIDLEKKVDNIPRGVTTIKGEKGDRGKTGRRGPKGGLRGRRRWPGETKVTTGRGRDTSGPVGDWDDKVSGDWDATSGTGERDGVARGPGPVGTAILDGPGAFDRGGVSDELPDKTKNPDISGIFDGTDDVDDESGLDEAGRQRQIDDKVDEIIGDEPENPDTIGIFDEEDEEEIPEGLDDALNDIRGEGEPKGEHQLDGEPRSSIKAPPKKPKPDKKKPKIKIRTRKIKPEDIKKGTPLDDDFKSRVLGEDDKGGYLSKEERIARFKGETFNPESVKPPDEGSSEEGTSEGEGKAENVLSGMGKSISTIADTVDSIFNTLKEQFEEQKDTKEDARVQKEQKDAEKDEKKLEGKGKIGKALEGASKKAMAPFQSIWDKFVNFLTTILFGKALMKIMDWFGNPENADKIKSFVRFLRDWWPVLLAGIMAFLPALLGPGGMIIGTVVLIAWALPKVISAVKWLMGLPAQIGKFLTGGDKENEKLDKEVDAEFTDAGKSVSKEIGMSTDLPQDEKEVKSDPRQQAEQEQGKETPPVDIEKQQEQQEPVGLNKGGTVPGKGDKDTVPAMLTPGEFVMTKGAVQKYGVDALEGMNAAAGGTNIPVVQIEEKKKKERGMGMGGIRGSIPAYNGGGTAGSKTKVIPQESMVPAATTTGSTAQVTPQEQLVPGSPTPADFGLPDDFDYDNPEHRELLVDVLTPHMKDFVTHQNAMVDENPEAFGGIKLKMDRDGRMPNFGEFVANMSESAFNSSVAMLQSNEAMQNIPEAKAGILNFMTGIRRQTLDNPNFKGDIAFDINKDIPGTAAYRLLMAAQQDTTSPAARSGAFTPEQLARQANRNKMSKGGLVQNFAGGGLVQNFAGGGLVQNFNIGGMVQKLPQVKAAKWMGGKAMNVLNMLPQVKAAKFVGGGLFKGIKNVIGKGKEVLGGLGSSGAAGADGGKGADGGSGLFSGFFSKVSKVPLVGPMLVSAGKDLVSGIDNLIVQKHLQLQESSSSSSDTSQLKVSSKTLKTSDIAPPSGKNVKVINQGSSSPKKQTPNVMIGSGDIPDFAVVHPGRKNAKQKTLGITN